MQKGIDKNKSLIMLFFLLRYHQLFFINYFTATTGKSQRSVLGIADTNEKLENSNLLASSLLGSVKPRLQ